jgi:hypothetical protein
MTTESLSPTREQPLKDDTDQPLKKKQKLIKESSESGFLSADIVEVKVPSVQPTVVALSEYNKLIFQHPI